MELENIVKIVEVSGDEIANDYLNVGYILLCVTVGNEYCRASYSLGWDKTKGDAPQKPTYHSWQEKCTCHSPEDYQDDDFSNSNPPF